MGKSKTFEDALHALCEEYGFKAYIMAGIYPSGVTYAISNYKEEDEEALFNTAQECIDHHDDISYDELVRLHTKAQLRLYESNKEDKDNGKEE